MSPNKPCECYCHTDYFAQHAECDICSNNAETCKGFHLEKERLENLQADIVARATSVGFEVTKNRIGVIGFLTEEEFARTLLDSGVRLKIVIEPESK